MYKYCEKLRFPHLNTFIKIIKILSISILFSVFLTACGSGNSKVKIIKTTPAIKILTSSEVKTGYCTNDQNNTVMSDSKLTSQQKTSNDPEKNDRDQLLNNSITIPDVCTNACLSIGSTQEAVNQYDICIMTGANNSNFGDGKLRPILLGGHNTKSLKYLYNAHINDIITVCYNNNRYEYKITYSNECINDGYKLYDIDTGINMLDYYVDQEILYIYTCYGNNNWLVKAARI